MFYFIERYGKYWNGGNPEHEAAWNATRYGAVTFKTKAEAWKRIREHNIENAEPKEF